MRSRKYLFWAAIVGVILLLNLPLPVCKRIRGGIRELISPFQRLVSSTQHRIKTSVGVLTARGKRASTIEELRAEVTKLNLKLGQAHHLDEENRHLREELQFFQNTQLDLIPCEVIGRGGSSGWWETVRINKGSADAITEKLAVVTSDGLVGETISVSHRTADVLLLSDRNCEVAARFLRSGSFGIVRGSGTGITGDSAADMCYPLHQVRTDYVAKGERIRKRDVVVSSGLGGVYPEGILIGHVESTIMHRSGLYQCAYLMPAADLQNLRYVYIVKKEVEEAVPEVTEEESTNTVAAVFAESDEEQDQ
jgi:rod shape-determining protein MreC